MQNARSRMGMLLVGGAAASLLIIPACAEQAPSLPSPAAPIATHVSPPLAPKPPESAELALNMACEAPPGVTCPLKIVGVRLAPSETTVTFRLETSRPGLRARIWPPGHPSAFRIRGASGQEHRLLRVEGVPLAPAVVTVSPGVSADFKLTFEPVSIQARSFDVVEGELETGSRTNTFRFMNIKLDGVDNLPNRATQPTSVPLLKVDPGAPRL